MSPDADGYFDEFAPIVRVRSPEDANVTGDNEATRPDHRVEAKRRVELLDAIIAALDRRTEVIDLIADSASAQDARARVSSLLGISDVLASAVLDLQWRRVAQLDRQRIVDERDELRRKID